MVFCHSDISHELHQASLVRNKLLSRAVIIISGLQSDTDNLLAAAELHSNTGLRSRSVSPSKSIEASRPSAPTPKNTPVIKIPARFKKASAASANNANTDHAYQRTMHDAAEDRNLLLKRAYDVICNLQVHHLPTVAYAVCTLCNAQIVCHAKLEPPPFVLHRDMLAFLKKTQMPSALYPHTMMHCRAMLMVYLKRSLSPLLCHPEVQTAPCCKMALP